MDVLSTGCQWRAIPKDLPPRSTVYDYFDLWDHDGTVRRLHHALFVQCREQAGREAGPTVAIIDSQSVKGAEKGGPQSTRRATTRARVRLDGAHHLWRKVPSGELSIDPEADERLGRATGRVEAS
jgi:transposase